MIKPIQILSDVISTTAHTVNISSIVDNGGGSYTLLVDNTYYLHNLSKLTIDSNDYRVKSFILNNTLVITGTVLPTVDVFILPSPIFVHGTPKKVSGELTTKQVKEYPLIWLLEFLDADYDDDFNSSITTVLDLNLFFLTDIHFENWDLTTHTTQAIDPMSNEIDFLIKIFQKRTDLFGEFTGHTVIDHVNFGEYITNQGYDKQILTDQVSGSQLKITLPYVVDVCNDTVIVSNCLPVTITENSIFKELVPSGGSFNYNTGSCADGVAENSDATFQTNVPSGGTTVLSDTTYEVYVDGVLESSATLPSLVNQTININWT